MQTVLGIDLGTQSLKTVFYEYHTRELVCVVSSSLKVTRRSDGTAEQEAGWWLEALQDCLLQVPAEIKRSVRSIGVSGQQHGFVPMDERGEVLAPVKLWCDTSTQAQVQAITEACGGREACIRLTGNPVMTGYTAPKIRWLKDEHPQLYKQLAHILLPHDYLNFLLTGRRCMEFGDASGTGLLDVRTRQWSAEMLRAVDPERDLTACLPQLVDTDGFIGTTSAECASAFGLPEGIPVAPGGGDNMMGAIGTGTVSPGTLTMSLGSSGTLYAYSDSPIVDPQGNIAAFCSSTGGWLPLLCTMNCTLGTELMRAPLGVELDQIDTLIGPVPPGSNGLTVLPFFNGERTPDLPNGRGCLLGLTSSNTDRGHILRATMEGATYSLYFGLQELRALGLEATEIVLTGGGSRSAVWRQMVADICQLPVSLLNQEEGAAFGAALQALWILQNTETHSLSIEQITREHLSRNEALCTQPNINNSRIYERGYADYQRALAQISPLYQN
ncbi:MAG: xylulokinase [Gammaproteobacteria bacterium]|nr:xylulokinase [Gammaproteobacteria bacterium]